MVQFDPTKIFRCMWQMRRWGRLLVIGTSLATGIAIVSGGLWLIGVKENAVVFWTLVTAVSMWVALYLCYLETVSRLKNKLGKVILEGERIRVILRGNTDADYDRCESHIQQWNISVDKIIKGTEYEQIWRSNVGLVTPEDVSGLVGLTVLFASERNYMYQRLSRLKEIRDSL